MHIEQAKLYRCTGRVNGKVGYRITVVAATSNHARRVARLWKDEGVEWIASQTYSTPDDGKVFIEWPN